MSPSTAITPFKIAIPSSDLDLLTAKLALTRLPPQYTSYTDDNNITSSRVASIIDFWQTSYNWRSTEAKLNQLPQFTTKIDVSDGFGTLEIHFIHSKATTFAGSKAIPLLFVHGWPGSCFEITKGFPALNEAGFDVVAPSLPGYGWSSYPQKKGFDLRKVAEVLQKLMVRLGYEKFVVQGGDWGSHIVRGMAIAYPENVMAMHVNMFQTHRMEDLEGELTERERGQVSRLFDWFLPNNGAYAMIQAEKPVSLGIMMHNDPVAMLVWMLDKLVVWSDEYPWTNEEIVTWTLLHYLPGPTTGFMMYHENRYPGVVIEASWAQEYIKQPCGLSAFPQELAMIPKTWAEKLANVKFYRYHDLGGHFAMHERPAVLVADIVEFVKAVWKA